MDAHGWRVQGFAISFMMIALSFAVQVTAATTEPVSDWASKAKAELQPKTSAVAGALPTPATIRAEVQPVNSVVERTALRFTFLFEPYQPRGIATYGAGQRADYSKLSQSVLGQVDLRWLPFELGSLFTRPVSAGGYTAFGFSRHKMPLTAPSGFRYDDVAVNTIRYELGVALGVILNSTLNLETRLGVGRISMIQTSQYSDVVGSFQQPFVVGAVDLAYHVRPRFALVASIAHRAPLGEGRGEIGFDPVTVSGGFLVQVR